MKSINRTFITIFMICILFFGFLRPFSSNEISQSNHSSSSQTITRSIHYNNLNEEVENLTFSINVETKMMNYDITFKDNSHDGATVQSYFFYIPASSENGNGSWNKKYLSDSDSIVKNKHASNSASFQPIEDLGVGAVCDFQKGTNVGIAYEENGVMVPATINPIRLHFFTYYQKLFKTNDDSVLSMNELKTNAELSFYLEYDDTLVTMNSIILKSHTDSELNQVLFDNSNDNYLVSGTNHISFELINNYHYHDLYLEYSFVDFQGAYYFDEIDITDNPNFVSGEAPTKEAWDEKAIIFLIIILLLMLFVILFIILIGYQIKKRRKLEKQQNQEYYDSNFNN